MVLPLIKRARIFLAFFTVSFLFWNLFSGAAKAELGDRDTSFYPLYLSNYVYSVALLTRGDQAGKYLIVGNFINGGSDPGTDRVARLTDDGARDASFNPASLTNLAWTQLELSSGKYLVGGQFNDAGGNTDTDRLVRLLLDGSRDPSFTPTKFTNRVVALEELSNNQILVGGYFVNAGGIATSDYLVRLDEDGSQDSTFMPQPLNNYIRTIDVLSDGKILIGGDFTDVNNNTVHDHLARLLSNGGLDEDFIPPALNGAVYLVLVLGDGGYLIGGEFTDVGGFTDIDYVAKLDSEGNLDSSFIPPILNGPVLTALEVYGGRYLIGGNFTAADNLTGIDYLARLNTDGSLDTSFITATLNAKVQSLAELPEGKYLIGGEFTNVGGDPDTDYVARLVAALTPNAPILNSALPGDQIAMLAWSPPADDGGNAITDYEYRLDGTGSWVSFDSTDTTATLTGLTNGTTYGVEVRAVNTVGQSPPSNSLDVTPMTVPDPPTLTSATPGNGTAVLAWNAPADNGGSAITDYEYRLDGTGSWVSFGSTDTTATLTGLTNGTTYGVEVRAVNVVGESAPSNRLDVTPAAPTVSPQGSIPIPVNPLLAICTLSILLGLLGLSRISGVLTKL